MVKNPKTIETDEARIDGLNTQVDRCCQHKDTEGRLAEAFNNYFFTRVFYIVLLKSKDSKGFVEAKDKSS